MDNTLCCETCQKSHREIPIIEKPVRFGSKTKIYELSQINLDNRQQDNICLACLQNEINQALEQ